MMFSLFLQNLMLFRSLLCVCAILSWAGLTAFLSDSTTMQSAEIVSLKKERLKAVRILRVLEEHRDSIDANQSIWKNKEAIILSVLESVATFSAEYELPLNDIRIDDSINVLADRTFSVMRIHVSVNVNHVSTLLSLFDAIKFGIDWLPLQVIECELERESSNASLISTCVIELMVFPELMT